MERKAIPNCDGYYADRRGGIWRKSRDIYIKVNPVLHDCGYQYTSIRGRKCLTQRLVCAAFKGESKLPICIRKAKRQQPRRVRSQRYLKWGSHSELGKRRVYRHMTSEQRLEAIRLYESGHTQCYIADKYGVSQPCISILMKRNGGISRGN